MKSVGRADGAQYGRTWMDQDDLSTWFSTDEEKKTPGGAR
jgi:hypothetical protein